MRQRTFDELVASGEASVRPGRTPLQEAGAACAQCGASRWAIDTGARVITCLACQTRVDVATIVVVPVIEEPDAEPLP